MSGANFLRKKRSCFLMLVSGVLLVSFAESGWAVEESVQHYKMLASVEYSGEGQFNNQTETLLSVRKRFFPDEKVQYFISSDDFNLLGGGLDAEQHSSSGEISFVIDKETGRMSGGDKNLAFLESTNNHCVSSLKKVTRDNIGKTWEQSFNVLFPDSLFVGELKFTLTAKELKTKAFGEVVAVEASSEPFIVKITGAEGRVGDVESKIDSVYLFDPQIKDIYLSVSVFEATTSVNGYKEQLRHQVGTYVTDAEGTSVSLRSLGWGFTKILWKMGVKKEGIKVKKESPLPQWARYEGLAAGRVAQLCAATACEGAPSPVATVYMPTTRRVAAGIGGKVDGMN